jgi:hypothetical protein
MSVRGIFASHNAIVGERIGDLASRVLMLGYSGTAPMLALSSGMPKEAAGDTSFSWTEDSHISGNTTATGAQTNVATSLNFGDTNIWTPNTVIMNQTTGEYMLITAVNSATNVTVVRGIGGTTGTAIGNLDVFQSIGTAFEEGGGRPSAITQKGESRVNYVQIFKNGWAVTGTTKAVKYLTGSQLAYNRSMALGYHVEDLERAFLFGRPGLMTLNNKQFRLSGGIVYQIENYGGTVTTANVGGAGNMNLDTIIAFLRGIFDRNVKGLPNERISFCGSAVVERINKMCRLGSQYQIMLGAEAWGIKVYKIVGINGDLNLVTHPLFVENSLWKNELHVYHPGLIKKRVLRDTWEESFSSQSSNNQGNDSDEGFIAMEAGFQVQSVETMGIMRNILAAVA